jgi:hypothetical protein
MSGYWRRAGLVQVKEGKRQDRPLLQAPACPRPDRQDPTYQALAVTHYGCNVMGTTMYLRKHHFPNVYAGVVH